jgi:LysM repeat protein
MNYRVSAAARAFAAAAVVGGFLLLVVVVVISISGDDDDGRDGRPNAVQTRSGAERKAPRSYVVQNGDTLTSIAREVGVSVSRIQELNPGLDPQILVSGEKLKLR